MRVLAISSYAGLGGAQLSLATFAEHRPAGVEVDAVVIGEGELPAHLAELGIRTATAPWASGRPGPRGVARFSRALGPLLAELRPDVVWATGSKGALLSLPACRLAGVPLVWHKVDLSFDSWLSRPLAAASSGVISVSEAAAEALGPQRSKVLGIVGPPIRLDPGVGARPDPERPVIGTLGRLVPYKGHHHILEAAAILSGEFPALRVVVAGGAADEYPEYPGRLRGMAAELGLDGRAELTGFVSDVRPLLERMTVYVSATYRDEEGFGFEALSGASLEASWAGIPVVAAAGGGAGEGIVHGRTGALVPESDPRLLAEAIRPYLRDPALVLDHGSAGREFARSRFAPGPASDHLFDLLAQACR